MSRRMTLTRLPDDEAAALWADLELQPDFSDHDRAALQDWLCSGEGRADLLQSHRRLIDDPVLAKALTARAAWARRRHGPNRRQLMALAASVAAVAFLGAPQLMTALGERHVTARGEARREALADGSQMHLNGATRARVKFGAQERQVSLVEGEAYFSVAHDPERPFRVRSPHGVITAVGTEFDVDRLGEATEVAVYEGRVRVEAARGEGAPIFLSAGERARIEGGVVLRLTDFEPAQIRDWRSGWLEVENAPLGELLTELNRASSMQIVASGAGVTGLPVSGRFRLSHPDAAAGMLSALHGLEVYRQGDKIVLTAPSG